MTQLNQPWRQLDIERRRQETLGAIVLAIYIAAGICLGIGLGALIFYR